MLPAVLVPKVGDRAHVLGWRLRTGGRAGRDIYICFWKIGRGVRLEELYDAFIKKLLHRHDEDLHMICDREEFFRLKGRGKREMWRKQYYYRCLTVTLAEKFIDVLEQHRNYVTAADIYDRFPHYNFHTVFQTACKVLGGNYSRGKCYTQLTVNDFKYFIQLRNATKTAEELMARWKQYLAGAGRLRVGGPEASQ